MSNQKPRPVVLFAVYRDSEGYHYRYAQRGSDTKYEHSGDRLTFAQFQDDALRLSGLHLSYGDLTDEEAEAKWQDYTEACLTHQA